MSGTRVSSCECVPHSLYINNYRNALPTWCKVIWCFQSPSAAPSGLKWMIEKSVPSPFCYSIKQNNFKIKNAIQRNFLVTTLKIWLPKRTKSKKGPSPHLKKGKLNANKETQLLQLEFPTRLFYTITKQQQPMDPCIAYPLYVPTPIIINSNCTKRLMPSKESV